MFSPFITIDSRSHLLWNQSVANEAESLLHGSPSGSREGDEERHERRRLCGRSFTRCSNSQCECAHHKAARPRALDDGASSSSDTCTEHPLHSQTRSHSLARSEDCPADYSRRPGESLQTLIFDSQLSHKTLVIFSFSQTNILFSTKQTLSMSCPVD